MSWYLQNKEFPPALIFSRCYQELLMQVDRPDTAALCDRIRLSYNSIADEAQVEGVLSADQRAACLAESVQHFNTLRTTEICLFCLLEQPEHVFGCGHAICDNCVVIFGEPFVCYRYAIPTCQLCLAQINFVARLKPPTAKPRLITVDGGGVRGTGALVLMADLQQALGKDVAIQDFFDLAVGTSSGE